MAFVDTAFADRAFVVMAFVDKAFVDMASVPIADAAFVDIALVAGRRLIVAFTRQGRVPLIHLRLPAFFAFAF